MATIRVYISRLTRTFKWQICLVFCSIMFEMLLHFYAQISQEVKIEVFIRLLSFYCCIRVIELIKLLATENCYRLPLMSNLMYILEIRKTTVLCAFFEIILRHFVMAPFCNRFVTLL